VTADTAAAGPTNRRRAFPSNLDMRQLLMALLVIVLAGCGAGAGFQLGPNGLQTHADADVPELNAGRVSFSTTANAGANAALPEVLAVRQVGYRVSSDFHRNGKVSFMFVPMGRGRAILDANLRVGFDVSSNVRFPISGSAKITGVRPVGNQPMQVVISMDGSGSMKRSDPSRRRVQAANRFVDVVARATPRNEFGVVEFDRGVSVRSELGGSLAATRNAIAEVDATGSTALFDSLMRSIDLLEASGKRNARRAILVLSDGRDNSSKATLQQVVKRARRSKVTIYAVSLGGALDQPNLGFVGPLQTLTAETRGAFVHVSRAEELVARFEAMAFAQTKGWMEVEAQLEALGGMFLPFSTITVQLDVEAGGRKVRASPVQFVVPLR